MSYVIRKLDPLLDITNTGELMQQLASLRSKLTHSNQQFNKLSQTKLKLETDAMKRGTLIASLQQEVATLKGDNSLFQKNHDELASSISAKDKEVKDVNYRAFVVVTVKTLLEEEFRETQKKLQYFFQVLRVVCQDGRLDKNIVDVD